MSIMASVRGVFASLVLLACLAPPSLCSTHPCEIVHPPDCLSHPPGSLHSHEGGCHLFYRCDELGKPRPFSCPAGTRFSTLGGEICLPEGRVSCQRCALRVQESCGEPTTPPPCMTSTTVDASTPAAESTPVESTLAQSTSTYHTESTRDVITTNFPTPTPIPICPPEQECEQLGQLLPYPSDCGQYIYCDSNLGTILSCVTGHHFSPVLLHCTSPDIANCPHCIEQVSTTMPPTSTISGCPPNPKCSMETLYFTVPYISDCSKYIYCDGSIEGNLRNCPVGTEYSVTLRRCMIPEIAQCQNCPSVQTSPLASTTVEWKSSTKPYKTTTEEWNIT